VKKIVQGPTGKILPSLSNLPVSTIHTKIVREALCALPPLFCCLYRHGVIFLRPTLAVETRTA
jgi:hypothetical protein